MGKKDLWQSDYFDDKRRFADMINGTLFKGKNFSILVLENQSYVDYRMVFRVMLEESLSYIKQQKRAYQQRKKEGYKFTQDEFLSRMRKGEKFVLVITLVLYLGKEKPWDGAKSLYDLLEIDEEWKPFINNHEINLFDYHNYNEFSQFNTENRFVFELLSSSHDKEKTGEVIEKYLNDYILDEEVVKAIFGMLDINEDIDKYKKETEEGEKYHMCKAWDDHKEQGRREGEQAAIRKSVKVLVDSLKKFSLDMEAIYNVVVENELYKDITREQVEKYYYAK